MGLADRVSAARRAERRTIGGVPWTPFVPFGSGGPVHPSRYHHGQDRALSLAPMYGAITLLADGVASLPLKIYRNDGGKKVLWTGPTIFDSPAPVGDYYDWIFQAMSSLLIHGNALGYIAGRDGFGYPTTIIWLPYEKCHIQDDETPDFASPVKPRYYFMGRQIPQEDLLHIKAFTVAGRTAGISPLEAFRLLIQGGHDQQAYSNEWFGNGGFPPGTFKNSEQEVDTQQSREIRANLTETLRLRQPLVYGRDWDYNPISVPPDQAQFVETSRLTATHFATIYQVPPDRIGGSKGDSLTYSSVEMATNDLITWSLRKWMRRLETAFFGIMPLQRYAKFDADDLVRTDQATRYANYKISREIGLETVDEMRDADDMPPLKSGVGAEELPGEVLVAMARGMGATPVTYEKLLITEKPPPPVTPPHLIGQPALDAPPRTSAARRRAGAREAAAGARAARRSRSGRGEVLAGRPALQPGRDRPRPARLPAAAVAD